MARVMIFVDGPNIGQRQDIVRIIERLAGARDVVATDYYDSAGPEGRTDYHDWLGGFRIQVTLLPHPRRVELVDYQVIVDMVSAAHEDRFDTAVLISGDVGYTSAVRKVRELNKRVEVAGFAGSVARDLQQAATEFYDLNTIASQIRRSRR